jgi:cytochrome c oxidase subunit 2
MTLAGRPMLPTQQESGAAAQSPRVIEISAKKYLFTPNEISVAAGEKVELRVHSIDEAHGVKLEIYPEGAKKKGAPGLVFDQPDQNGKVEKGVDQILDFTAKAPGTYDFKCARICGMGHGRMKGKVIVGQ